jgi:hypothetical protein
LLWEHPISHSLWLGKALPRSWLSEGSEAIRLIDGATAYGRLSFELTSSIASNASIHANLTVPQTWSQAGAGGGGAPPPGGLLLRLRAPGKRSMRRVTVGGVVWAAAAVNVSAECVVFTAAQLQDPGMAVRMQDIVVAYTK